MDSAHLAVGVFMHPPLEGRLRAVPNEAALQRPGTRIEASHFHRFERTADSLETSSLHLDLINDLARTNSRVCAIGTVFLNEQKHRPLLDELGFASARDAKA